MPVTIVSPSDPYAVVLSDLRKQLADAETLRQQLIQTIALLESVRNNSSSNTSLTPTVAHPLQPTTQPGPYTGMTVVDATKKLLVERGTPLVINEIVSALRQGGLSMNSADPSNTVNSILSRRMHEKGDVVRVGRGTWGLLPAPHDHSSDDQTAKSGTTFPATFSSLIDRLSSNADSQ